MKNYPLLKFNNKDIFAAWEKTYTTELNNNVKALWDYINYFLPDYCEYSLTTSAGQLQNPTSLPYNGYYRATEAVKVTIGGVAKDLGAGYLLLSRARNEDEKKYKNDWNYYFIQPFGYGSFYIYSYNENGLVAIYDQYAEETYGLNYMTSIFPSYPRYKLKSGQSHSLQDNAWRFPSYTAKTNTYWIATINNTLWTDPYQLIPMHFCYLGDEEVIIDSRRDISVKIDGVNVCQYTITVPEKGGQIWPWDTENSIKVQMI